MQLHNNLEVMKVQKWKKNKHFLSRENLYLVMKWNGIAGKVYIAVENELKS